jgi:hypothetical protein
MSGSQLPVGGSSVADYFTPHQPKMTKALSGSSLSPIENLPPSAQLGKNSRINRFYLRFAYAAIHFLA